ncbi:MAG: transcription antitermination factor NusB [Epulopiscium sp. Nuni2H_MBin003]|nr:MAG: transcription antitermination factor NusB [Epulopiscium sp. Nuni2H_MBin003]
MTRREARECIVQMQYNLSFHNIEDATQILEQQLKEVKGKVKNFITEEYNGVIQNQSEIDNIIIDYLNGWNIDRIARVDLMILRLAIYEIKWQQDVPNKVAITEAVEISKTYSTEKSPQFINGILAKVVGDE